MKILIILAVKVHHGLVDTVEEQCVSEISYVPATANDVDNGAIVDRLFQVVEVVFVEHLLVEKLRLERMRRSEPFRCNKQLHEII